MSKGSFQKYQHYLPATYIRRFKITDEDPKAGKDTVYGFVKTDAKPKETKKRIDYFNAKKICGQDWRHTLYIGKERDNLIEDLFKMLEDTYPEFVKCMSKFYRLKEYFRRVSGQGYFIKKYNWHGVLTKRKLKRLDAYSSFHEIDLEDLKNMAFFMARFLCYRNENMDAYFQSEQMPGLKNVSFLIKKILRVNRYLMPSGTCVISSYEWKAMLSLLNHAGLFLVDSDMEQRRDIVRAFKRIHRYMAMPFYSAADESGCKVYLYCAPKGREIVSCDFPFVFLNGDFLFGNGCYFTISPAMALVFTRERFVEQKPADFSDSISALNVSQAKKYIFSSSKERLAFFTKDIKQTLTQSYEFKSKK